MNTKNMNENELQKAINKALGKKSTGIVCPMLIGVAVFYSTTFKN